MKKFIVFVIAMLFIATAFGQENYKLGDFNKSEVKAKSLRLSNGWIFDKTSTTNTLNVKYGTTTVATFTSAGVFTPLYSADDVYATSVTLDSTNIKAMYATPVTVVAAPGAGKAIQVIGAVLIYDRTTASYTGGGATYLLYPSFASITDTITPANSFRASGDKVYRFSMLDPAGGISLPVNTAVAITNSAAAYTNTSAATGTGTIKILYKIITTGL